MLGSITCDTPISEIISESDISGDIENINQSLSNFEKEIKKTINEEQTNGGLSSKGFLMDKKPTLTEKSNKVLDSLQTVSNWNKIVEQIKSNLEIQRKEEIKCLKMRVSDKIDELNKELAEIDDYLTRAANDPNGNYPDVAKCEKLRPEVEQDLKQYQEKLKMLEGMK